LGECKSDVLARRLTDINPEGKFSVVSRFVAPSEVSSLLDSAPFDGVADAIDDVETKVALLLECKRRKLPVVSSMGAGNKRDPGMVETADISKSRGCPLARAVRRRLREAGVEKGVTVVFSPEVIKTASGFGTLSYMTAAFGAHCASALLEKLVRMSGDV